MRVYLYVLACLVALMPLSANASKKQKKARKAKTELWQTARRWTLGSCRPKK